MAASTAALLVEQTVVCWDNHLAAHWAAAAADETVCLWVGRKVEMMALGMAALKVASSVVQ